MRRFREFFLAEAGPRYYQPRVSRIVGIYDLPDLGAATQLGQTPIGGYSTPGDAMNWHADIRKFNQRYPLEIHNVDSSKVDKELSSISIEQMRAAMTDLAQRIQSTGSVLASAGTHPGDRDMSSRTREAHFDGQKHKLETVTTPSGFAQEMITRGDAVEPGVNVNIIRNLDGRAFYGEVSGRGGTQGFKIGEALRVIVPAQTGSICPDCEEAHLGSHFDIYVDKLAEEMQKAMAVFTQFERQIGAMRMAGQGLDKVVGYLGDPHGVPVVRGMQSTLP